MHKIIFTCVFQAGRRLLNASDFSTFQNNFLPYKTSGVNLLDLIGFLTEIVYYKCSWVLSRSVQIARLAREAAVHL